MLLARNQVGTREIAMGISLEITMGISLEITMEGQPGKRRIGVFPRILKTSSRIGGLLYRLSAV